MALWEGLEISRVLCREGRCPVSAVRITLVRSLEKIQDLREWSMRTQMLIWFDLVS